MNRISKFLVLAATCGVLASAGLAQEATPSQTGFDAVAATEAYLARLSPAERERSDSYFEGGYWLDLWDFLWAATISVALLMTGLSARMRDRAARWAGGRRPLVVILYWIQYLSLVSLASLPLAVYRDYVREHAYGLSNQSLGEWFQDRGKGFLVGLVLGALFLPVLWSVFRRASRTWWVWGAGASLAFLAFVMVVAPVYIAPVFNDYVPLADPATRDRILSLARANGVPADEVYEMDASRQSKRISANVSGLFGTERITLNDNLLSRCGAAEIDAVMGHEMGHYVLNHVYEMLLQIGAVLVVGFALVRIVVERALYRRGARWNVSEISDPAVLPLLALAFSAYFMLATPIVNSIVRANESEADLFGLNAAGEPDGFAEVALKLGEYRKLAPSEFEEALFFDHPSGRTRILMAMRWKAENLATTR